VEGVQKSVAEGVKSRQSGVNAGKIGRDRGKTQTVNRRVSELNPKNGTHPRQEIGMCADCLETPPRYCRFIG